jgi:polyphosphate kinase
MLDDPPCLRCAPDRRAPNRSSSTLADQPRFAARTSRRVLALAQDASIPLLERLRYLTIVASNLDEFFEIRVAGLMGHLRRRWRRRA